MKLLYNCSIDPVYAETQLVPALVPSESDLFIEKTENFITVKLEILKPDLILDLYAEIYEQKKNRKGYKVVSNTTAIKGTNILDSQGNPYYYKVVSSKDFKESSLNFITVFKVDGVYYTNEEVINRNIEDGTIINTELVLDLREQSSTIVHSYRRKDIEMNITLEDDSYIFSPIYTNILEPQLLNNNSIQFPSFVCKDKRYIEGDVKILEKEEYGIPNLNTIQPKQKMIENLTNGTFQNFTNNTIILPTTNLESKLIKYKYKAKFSSHQFRISSILYFKLTPFMIEPSTKEEADFSVSLKVDRSKLNIYPNLYKNDKITKNVYNDFILCSKNPSSSKDVAFKRYLEIDYTFFPSTSYYVKQGDSVYYTHTNTMEVLPIPSIEGEEVKQKQSLKDAYIHIQDSNITYFKSL